MTIAGPVFIGKLEPSRSIQDRFEIVGEHAGETRRQELTSGDVLDVQFEGRWYEGSVESSSGRYYFTTKIGPSQPWLRMIADEHLTVRVPA